MPWKKIWKLLQVTFTEWREDDVSRLAAALSYYTLFSLPPLLLIVVAVAGFFLDRETVRAQIINQAASLLGPQGASALGVMLDNAGWSQSAGVWATVLGVVTLLVGATGAFAQLQQTLNIIWEVTPRPDRGIWAMIKDRLLSFSMVLGIAFLLLVSLVISTALQALSGAIQGLVPDAFLVGRILSFVLSFGVITLLFALIFKYLPDAEVSWGDVWVGAAVTALLFAIGKFLLGLYLGRSGAASAYGAAGALVLILLWIYYSAQILGLGAEFTQVYGRQFGSRIVPAENAMRVGDAGQMNGRAVDGREQK